LLLAVLQDVLLLLDVDCDRSALTFFINEIAGGVLELSETIHPIEPLLPAGLFQLGFKVQQLLRRQEVRRTSSL